MTEKQLPKGWHRFAFGEVAKQCRESSSRDDGVFDKYIEGGHMDSNKLNISRWGVFGDHYVGPAFHRVFRKGQILYGSRRTYLRKIAIASFDGITANTTFVIEPVELEGFFSPLLPFVMLSENFTKHSVSKSKGSTNPYVSWRDLCDFKFALPDIDKQKAIYEALNKKQESIEALEGCRLNLGKIFQLLLKDLVCAGVTEKNVATDIPNGWELKTLREVADYQMGKSFPSVDYTPQGVKLIRPGNLAVDGAVRWTSSNTICVSEKYRVDDSEYIVLENEILMNLTAQSLDDGFLGRVCITGAGEEALLNQRIARITPTPEGGVNLRFLYWALKSRLAREYLNRMHVGTKVKHLYNSELENIPLLIPVDKKKQDEIAEVMDRLVGVAEILSGKAKAIDDLKLMDVFVLVE